MPLRSVYGSKESDLHQADQSFLTEYREFQDALRTQKNSPLLASSIHEHRQQINCREISITGQEEYIKEILRFHGWACLEKDRLTHQVLMTDIILSYDDLYSFCQFRQKRGNKLWSLNKISQAILSVIKFIKAKRRQVSVSKLDEMLHDTRALYRSIARSASAELHDRPSLDEQRERGEALSFLDIVKVCEGQHWRVKILSNFSKRDKLSDDLKEGVRALLVNEAKNLAVLSTLLKYPTRKVETQKSVIERAGETWRLKLSSSDRKNRRQPINVKLSPMEVQTFQLLRGHTEENAFDSWQPFKGMKITNIIKATTLNMTGIGVTVTGLRCAAESHVDVLDYDCTKIQRALSYVEGHSDRIAKMFYKRNGSSTIMKAWTKYVDKLMNRESDDDVSAVDQKIINSISSSQKHWINEVQHKIWRIHNRRQVPSGYRKRREVPGGERKRRVDWSAEEDEELRERIGIHGDGNWKDIFDCSPILQKRYQGTTVKRARENVKTRWRKLKIGDGSMAIQYPRHRWSEVDNNALELAVSIYGTNWKDILDNTKLLRDIYDHMPGERAQDAIERRWYSLKSSRDREKCHSSEEGKLPARKKRRVSISPSKRTDELKQGERGDKDNRKGWYQKASDLGCSDSDSESDLPQKISRRGATPRASYAVASHPRRYDIKKTNRDYAMYKEQSEDSSISDSGLSEEEMPIITGWTNPVAQKIRGKKTSDKKRSSRDVFDFIAGSDESQSEGGTVVEEKSDSHHSESEREDNPERKKMATPFKSCTSYGTIGFNQFDCQVRSDSEEEKEMQYETWDELEREESSGAPSQGAMQHANSKEDHTLKASSNKRGCAGETPPKESESHAGSNSNQFWSSDEESYAELISDCDGIDNESAYSIEVKSDDDLAMMGVRRYKVVDSVYI